MLLITISNSLLPFYHKSDVNYIHHQHLVNCVIYRVFRQNTARFVCKQALHHAAVSVVQIPVWYFNIHRTYMMRQVTDG